MTTMTPKLFQQYNPEYMPLTEAAITYGSLHGMCQIYARNILVNKIERSTIKNTKVGKRVFILRTELLNL